MANLSRIVFFLKQYQKQIQKKWKSLPLLLVFPILIIGLIFLILVSLLLPDEQQSIEVGLVDLDESEETTMLVDLIDEASLLGSYIHIKKYTAEEAQSALDMGTLSAYVTFPENFTTDLYQGHPVKIPIMGNQKQPVKSYIIKELLNSMTRYIASAQANILTINQYAKSLPIEDAERQEILLNQFNQFMLFTLSKDNIIQEEQISNLTTTSPVQYYSIAGWFILITIWMLSIYILIGKEDGLAIQNRMRLYGVTRFQQMVSRMLLVFIYGLVLGLISLFAFINLLKIEFYFSDYLRAGIVISLYSLLLLLVLAVIELIFTSKKVSLLVQISVTSIVLLLSGALIPTLYFPEQIKAILPFVFSTEAFHWLTELVLKGRLFIDVMPLLLLMLAGLGIFMGCSLWKERAKV
ncbi:ABC transporter permease [Paraliobacillus ryukyuensis]|uniref:ABC transporter permease n=1 Tax=Paraliobacillus ryukyuensis TaxID=200904 RepID=UPI0009A8E025|nr:ABC transporter permease [Paraliobacillus ryukyuensis]